MEKLTIKGQLPGLNEYIDACRRHPKAGARMKRDAEETVIWSAKASRLRKIKTPVVCHYVWYEPNKRRDKDNISAFGRKVIQDALVTAKYLTGDGWAQIAGFTDDFFIDQKNPHIEVIFQEVNEK